MKRWRRERERVKERRRVRGTCWQWWFGGCPRPRDRSVFKEEAEVAAGSPSRLLSVVRLLSRQQPLTSMEPADSPASSARSRKTAEPVASPQTAASVNTSKPTSTIVVPTLPAESKSLVPTGVLVRGLLSFD